jgi:hypothetical protein
MPAIATNANGRAEVGMPQFPEVGFRWRWAGVRWIIEDPVGRVQLGAVQCRVGKVIPTLLHEDDVALVSSPVGIFEEVPEVTEAARAGTARGGEDQRISSRGRRVAGNDGHR